MTQAELLIMQSQQQQQTHSASVWEDINLSSDWKWRDVSRFESNFNIRWVWETLGKCLMKIVVIAPAQLMLMIEVLLDQGGIYIEEKKITRDPWIFALCADILNILKKKKTLLCDQIYNLGYISWVCSWWKLLTFIWTLDLRYGSFDWGFDSIWSKYIIEKGLID